MLVKCQKLRSLLTMIKLWGEHIYISVFQTFLCISVAYDLEGLLKLRFMTRIDRLSEFVWSLLVPKPVHI